MSANEKRMDRIRSHSLASLVRTAPLFRFARHGSLESHGDRRHEEKKRSYRFLYGRDEYSLGCVSFDQFDNERQPIVTSPKILNLPATKHVRRARNAEGKKPTLYDSRLRSSSWMSMERCDVLALRSSPVSAGSRRRQKENFIERTCSCTVCLSLAHCPTRPKYEYDVKRHTSSLGNVPLIGG